MKLEEVLPALREGKKIRRRMYCGGYFIVLLDGIIAVRDPYEACFIRFDLLSADVLAEDWEVVE